MLSLQSKLFSVELASSSQGSDLSHPLNPPQIFPSETHLICSEAKLTKACCLFPDQPQDVAHQLPHPLPKQPLESTIPSGNTAPAETPLSQTRLFPALLECFSAGSQVKHLLPSFFLFLVGSRVEKQRVRTCPDTTKHVQTASPLRWTDPAGHSSTASASPQLLQDPLPRHTSTDAASRCCTELPPATGDQRRTEGLSPGLSQGSSVVFSLFQFRGSLKHREGDLSPAVLPWQQCLLIDQALLLKSFHSILERERAGGSTGTFGDPPPV